MMLAGFIAAMLIGVSLGLIGGGGSILTVPVLVYLFNIEPLLATSYSLFVVGTTSLAGAIKQYKEGNVNIRIVLLFSIASVTTVIAVRKLLLPLIPETIIATDNVTITKSVLIMLLFALLMFLAAYFMLRKTPLQSLKNKTSIGKLLVYGVIIGIVTGLLGAGGGFLLIPALVLLVHLPMKKAIGTSLSIIAATSLLGFAGDLHQPHINWGLLLSITGLAIIGIIAGTLAGKRAAGEWLKIGFGWFLLLMGLFVLVSQILLLDQ